MRRTAAGGPTLSDLTGELAQRLTAEARGRREVMLLIAHLSGRSPADLLACLADPAEDVLDAGLRRSLQALVKRRANGEPLAYLTGEREFFSRRFRVGPGCLIPRPETEHLVELGLAAIADMASARVVDCCTGSGCVGITIAAERERNGRATELLLTDRSAQALEWATRNAREHVSARSVWQTREADLLDACPPATDLIVANPPYLTPEETDAALAQGWGEPAMALDGGADGLSLYPRLADDACRLLRPGGWLILEHGEGQGELVRSMLAQAGLVDIRQEFDLAGRDRNVAARRREE